MFEGVGMGWGRRDFQQLYVAKMYGFALRVVLGLGVGAGGGEGGVVRGEGGAGDELELQRGWLER